MDLSSQAVKRRLGLNLMVGAGSQIVSTIQQVVFVPILLYAWGREPYGVFVLLLSVEAIFQFLADFGLSNATAAELCMARARGDTDRARNLFRNALVFSTLSSLLVALAGILTLWLLPLASLMGIPGPWQRDAVVALTLSCISLAVMFATNVCCNAFKAEGKVAQVSFYYWVVSRLVTLIAMATVALAGGGVLAIFVTTFCARIMIAITAAGLARSRIHWVSFSVRGVSWRDMRLLIGPALAHTANPIALIVNITGFNLVVSILVGPSAVATLSVIRTFGNLALQAYTMLNSAIWPELSTLIGGGQHALAAAVIKRSGRLCFWIAVLAVTGLAVAGGPLLRFWTGGTIPMVWSLWFCQLATVLLGAIWRSPSTVLLAANRNRSMAGYTVSASLLSLALMVILARFLGLNAVGPAILISECLLLWGILGQALRFVELPLREYLASLAAFPTRAEVTYYLGSTLAIFRRRSKAPLHD